MRTRLLATIAALSLTLTACGGDQEPEADPPTPIQSSATPSPSADITQTPPPVETESQGSRKREPLDEFSARWLEANHAMQTTGDLEEYKRFVTKDCMPCNDLMSRVTAIYSSGGSIRFAGSTVKKIGAEKTASGLTSFDLTYTAGITRVRETKGAKESILKGGDQLLSVSVRNSPTGWRVVTFAKYHN